MTRERQGESLLSKTTYFNLDRDVTIGKRAQRYYFARYVKTKYEIRLIIPCHFRPPAR